MSEIKFSSQMTVDLMQVMASDEMVARAAWVSTKGEDAKDYDPANAAGLINYLVRDHHGSPFEHNMFTFFVKCPLFVAREFMRHRIASYNEESGRYTQLKPEFYIIDKNRAITQQGKPGNYSFVAGDDSVVYETQVIQRETAKRAYSEYEYMLELGVAKEVARMHLPLNIFTSFYVTMNARGLMNFLSLRTEVESATFVSHPQKEIQMVANKMEGYFGQQMPLTYAAWNKNGRVAP